MYNKSLMVTTSMPQRIYTQGAVLKGFQSKFTQYLTEGDLILRQGGNGVFEIRKVTGVVDDDTALLASAFSANINPVGSNPITDGGQNLIVVFARTGNIERGFIELENRLQEILGGSGVQRMITGAVTNQSFDLLQVIQEGTVLSALTDENDVNLLTLLNLTGVALSAGTVIRANNGMKIKNVTVNAGGSVAAYTFIQNA